MASSGRKCSNDPNTFCYICGEYTLKDQRRSISDFVRKAYFAYFEVKLGDQNSSSIFGQFNLEKHNNLSRNLNLSKECSEILHPGTKITYYRHREEGLLHYFSHQEGLVFCNDIGGLLLEMGVPQYWPEG
ncbi:hypothetical protein LOD99_1679 [Oopsacas minuta]|uniref:Uncharacterized protein n=1 Tax=Oopsacas minuta TaxID=111878 RepID=A0AAV7K5P5_9METZ|nr:hypothetical protein LOD99_1679 [Oopsacas minuta]